MVSVDAAIVWPNRKIYFFSGDEYYGYDIDSERVPKPDYPKPIKQYWPGLRPPIQGAMVWNSQFAYFFGADMCYRYDIQADRVDDSGAVPTRVRWPGVLAGPYNDYRIDAAIPWDNGRTYLFQHDRYYAFDSTTGLIVPGMPRMIQDGWRNLWFNGRAFNAGFIYPNLVNGLKKAYFFQPSIYVRYDVASDAMEANDYPRQTSAGWTGL
jgi:hypothetical protein